MKLQAMEGSLQKMTQFPETLPVTPSYHIMMMPGSHAKALCPTPSKEPAWTSFPLAEDCLHCSNSRFGATLADTRDELLPPNYAQTAKNKSYLHLKLPGCMQFIMQQQVTRIHRSFQPNATILFLPFKAYWDDTTYFKQTKSADIPGLKLLTPAGIPSSVPLDAHWLSGLGGSPLIPGCLVASFTLS